MKFIKTYETFFTDLEIPPTQTIINDDNDGQNDEFRYDFKITGVRFRIKSDNPIELDVDILNYNQGNYLNKYKINTGYVCFNNVKSYYYNNEYQMLNMIVYYSSDVSIPQGRLKLNELIPELSRIIYENIEKPFKYDGNLGYEFWDKQAWLTV